MIIRVRPFRTLLMAIAVGAAAAFFAVKTYQQHVSLMVPVMFGAFVVLASLVAVASLRQVDRALRVFFE